VPNPTATWPDGTPAPCPDHQAWAAMRPAIVSDTSTATMWTQTIHPGPEFTIPVWFWTRTNGGCQDQYMNDGGCLQCHMMTVIKNAKDVGSPPALHTRFGSIPEQPRRAGANPKSRATSTHFGFKHYRAFKLAEDGRKLNRYVTSPVFFPEIFVFLRCWQRSG